MNDVELARELRDLSACLRRVPKHCLRDGIALIEWHADLAKRLARAANLLVPAEPRPRSPEAVTSPTRFEPGRIETRGRIVRVEIRRRRAA